MWHRANPSGDHCGPAWRDADDADGEYIRSARRGDGFGEIALVADMPRIGTVTASGPGSLLAIDRDDFLLAVTGHEPAHDAAWHILHTKGFGHHRTGGGDDPEPIET